MSFEDISAALFRHFRCGASEWHYPRVRQALVQTRQLEKDSVTDYSYSLRTNYGRLNLPRTKWTHYAVQSLQPKTRDNSGAPAARRAARAEPHTHRKWVNHTFHFSWSEWSVPWFAGAVSDDDGGVTPRTQVLSW